MTQTTADVVLRPVRFTDDVAGMQRLLELVGLRSRVESERGGWVDLVGTSGMLALHQASTSAHRTPAGVTTLSYECTDANALAERLRAAGLRAEVVDESYGRVLLVTGDGRWRLVADEVQHDLHGYRRHESGAPTCAVRAVVRTHGAEPLAAILGVLGGDVEVRDGDDHPTLGPDDEWYLAAPVRPVLLTGEPLDELAARVEAAGFPVAHSDGVLAVTDPDGRLVEVRRA